ncbi:hypothetical protein BRC90_02630 [Halobacteriales archaeon QS_4_69_34]|nr:MAG: hypothetical protein BRC90_02630 [Halobacteriales archaeon QS_4_69_34]
MTSDDDDPEVSEDDHEGGENDSGTVEDESGSVDAPAEGADESTASRPDEGTGSRSNDGASREGSASGQAAGSGRAAESEDEDGFVFDGESKLRAARASRGAGATEDAAGMESSPASGSHAGASTEGGSADESKLRAAGATADGATEGPGVGLFAAVLVLIGVALVTVALLQPAVLATVTDVLDSGASPGPVGGPGDAAAGNGETGTNGAGGTGEGGERSAAGGATATDDVTMPAGGSTIRGETASGENGSVAIESVTIADRDGASGADGPSIAVGWQVSDPEGDLERVSVRLIESPDGDARTLASRRFEVTGTAAANATTFGVTAGATYAVVVAAEDGAGNVATVRWREVADGEFDG